MIRSGTNRPTTTKLAGINVDRKNVANCVSLMAVQNVRRNGNSWGSGGMPGIRKNESRMTRMAPKMIAAWMTPRMPPRISSAKRAFWNSCCGL